MRYFQHASPCLAFLILFGLVSSSRAQAPEMPKPTPQHELLSQFAGTWHVTTETAAIPGMEAFKCEGTETAKVVGGFWLISEMDANMSGIQMTNVMTLGYNPEKKKYIGTFVCSADSTLWKYEGKMDESGKKLTLLTEGPNPMSPGQTAKYREVLELKDKDHKVFTSDIQTDSGEWARFMTMEYERKKDK